MTAARGPCAPAPAPRGAPCPAPGSAAWSAAAAPSAANYANLIHCPYTATEVLAAVRAADPLSDFAAAARRGRLDAAAVDLTASRLLLRDRGAGLVDVALRPGADPLAVLGQLQ